jgi:hypothetical protein
MRGRRAGAGLGRALSCARGGRGACWAGSGCRVRAERGERTGPARVREVGEGRTGPVGFLGRVSVGFGLVLGLGFCWVFFFSIPFLFQTNSN